MDIHDIYRLIKLENVEAITQSDFVIYIYITSEKSYKDLISASAKLIILKDDRFEKSYSMLINGMMQQVVVRVLSSFMHELNKIVFEHMPKFSLSTSQWHQLKHHHIAYDPLSKYHKLARRYQKEYPIRLQSRIIEKHTILFEDVLFYQLKSACEQQNAVQYTLKLEQTLHSLIEIFFARELKTYDTLESGFEDIHTYKREDVKLFKSKLMRLIETTSWKKRLDALDWFNNWIHVPID